MKKEIERKYLIANDDWKLDIISATYLTDGLLSKSRENKVRIRTQSGKALITIKSKRIGFARTEYEYPISITDAEEMLANLCGKRVCQKTRFLVPSASHIWSVDVYDGLLDGVVIAEIELTHEEEEFELPGWVGQEVTSQAGYGKWRMLAQHYTASMDAARLNAG